MNVILAIDEVRGIGKNGEMPWRLSGEVKYFKTITQSTHNLQKKNVVIMGRVTWESIPEKFRPLSDRINIVLTRNQEYSLPEGVLSFTDIDNLLNYLRENQEKLNYESIFVIGGQQVIEATIQRKECQRLFITHIKSNFNCDRFFPDFSKDYKLVSSKDVCEENGVQYYFAEYVRIF